MSPYFRASFCVFLDVHLPRFVLYVTLYLEVTNSIHIWSHKVVLQ